MAMIMMPDGRSPRATVPAPQPAATQPQPAPTGGSGNQNVNGGANDAAAARAAELRRQLEALLEALRKAQEQARIAAEQAAQARREADAARQQAETARQHAEQTKAPADIQAANAAERRQRQAEAHAREQEADAAMKARDAELKEKQVLQKQEQLQSPEGKSSAATDQAVRDAESGLSAAQGSHDRAVAFVGVEDKEIKALEAEERAAAAQPPAGLPSHALGREEWAAIDTARNEATRLRTEADQARSDYDSKAGGVQGFGGPQMLASEADVKRMSPPRAMKVADGIQDQDKPPASTPLADLLSVPVPPAQPQTAAANPSGQPPTQAQNVDATLRGIAGGKSLSQIAAARGIGVDELISEAGRSGVQISPETAPTTDNGDVQSITVKQHDAEATFTHDYQHDRVTVTGSFADPAAEGGRRQVHAWAEGSGKTSANTVRDPATGQVTTTIERPESNSVKVMVEDRDGRLLRETITQMGQPVVHVVKPGENASNIFASKGTMSWQQFVEVNGLTNPDQLSVGQTLTVSSTRTSRTEYLADGSKLQTQTAEDGTRQTVYTTANGRQLTLEGAPTAGEAQTQAARTAVFTDKIGVPAAAARLGVSEDQVLKALGTDNVFDEAPSAANGNVRTRTIYDPSSNSLVVERFDPAKGPEPTREFVAGDQAFDVNHDPLTGKDGPVKLLGGVGYMQQKAEQRGETAGAAYDARLTEVNQAINIGRRTGEPIAELQQERKQLIALKQGLSDGDEGRATQVAASQLQYQSDRQAVEIYGYAVHAPPGSELHGLANAALPGALANVDNMSRTVHASGANVREMEANSNVLVKQQALTQADADLYREFIQWKETTFLYGKSPEQVEADRKQGIEPFKPIYSSVEEEYRIAWETFEEWQRDADEGSPPPNLSQSARNAWVARNAARDGLLQAEGEAAQARTESNAADKSVNDGAIARAQADKDAWMAQNPGTFPGLYPGQGELDALQGDNDLLDIDTLDARADIHYVNHFMALPGAARYYTEDNKEATEKYLKDTEQSSIDRGLQISQLETAGSERRNSEASAFVERWRAEHPELAAKLDAIGLHNGPTTSVRAAEARQSGLDELMKLPEMQALKPALDAQEAAKAEATGMAQKLVDDIDADLKKADAGIEKHSALRDIWSWTWFGDEDATKERDFIGSQRNDAQNLKNDLANGDISLSAFYDRQENISRSYGRGALGYRRATESDDQFWDNVDTSVKTTAGILAGVVVGVVTKNPWLAVAAAKGVMSGVGTINDGWAFMNGRNVAADGELSSLGWTAKLVTGKAQWSDLGTYAKSEVDDWLRSGASVGGVVAGARTAISLGARWGTSSLTRRAGIGAVVGETGAAVEGFGNFGADVVEVAFEGQWGTEQGKKRIQDSMLGTMVGLAVAPVSGAISGGLPLPKNMPAVGAAMQFVNEGASGIVEVNASSLATEGRWANKGEYVGALIESVGGTAGDLITHPLANKQHQQAMAGLSNPGAGGTPHGQGQGPGGGLPRAQPFVVPPAGGAAKGAPGPQGTAATAGGHTPSPTVATARGGSGGGTGTGAGTGRPSMPALPPGVKVNVSTGSGGAPGPLAANAIPNLFHPALAALKAAAQNNGTQPGTGKSNNASAAFDTAPANRRRPPRGARRRPHGASTGQRPLPNPTATPGNWNLVHGKINPLARGLNPQGLKDACVQIALALGRRLQSATGEHGMLPFSTLDTVRESKATTLGEVHALHGAVEHVAFLDAENAQRFLKGGNQYAQGYIVMLGEDGEHIAHMLNFQTRNGRLQIVDGVAGRNVKTLSGGRVEVIVTHRDGRPTAEQPLLLQQPVLLRDYGRHAQDVARGKFLPDGWFKGLVGKDDGPHAGDAGQPLDPEAFAHRARLAAAEVRALPGDRRAQLAQQLDAEQLALLDLKDQLDLPATRRAAPGDDAHSLDLAVLESQEFLSELAGLLVQLRQQRSEVVERIGKDHRPVFRGHPDGDESFQSRNQQLDRRLLDAQGALLRGLQGLIDNAHLEARHVEELKGLTGLLRKIGGERMTDRDASATLRGELGDDEQLQAWLEGTAQDPAIWAEIVKGTASRVAALSQERKGFDDVESGRIADAGDAAMRRDTPPDALAGWLRRALAMSELAAQQAGVSPREMPDIVADAVLAFTGVDAPMREKLGRVLDDHWQAVWALDDALRSGKTQERGVSGELLLAQVPPEAPAEFARLLALFSHQRDEMRERNAMSQEDGQHGDDPFEAKRVDLDLAILTAQRRLLGRFAELGSTLAPRGGTPPDISTLARKEAGIQESADRLMDVAQQRTRFEAVMAWRDNNPDLGDEIKSSALQGFPTLARQPGPSNAPPASLPDTAAAASGEIGLLSLDQVWAAQEHALAHLRALKHVDEAISQDGEAAERGPDEFRGAGLTPKLLALFERMHAREQEMQSLLAAQPLTPPELEAVRAVVDGQRRLLMALGEQLAQRSFQLGNSGPGPDVDAARTRLQERAESLARLSLPGGEAAPWHVVHGKGIGQLAEGLVHPDGVKNACVPAAMAMGARLASATGKADRAVAFGGATTLGPVHAAHGNVEVEVFPNAQAARDFLDALQPGAQGYIALSAGSGQAHAHLLNFVVGNDREVRVIDALAGKEVRSMEAQGVTVIVTHRDGQPVAAIPPLGRPVPLKDYQAYVKDVAEGRHLPEGWPRESMGAWPHWLQRMLGVGDASRAAAAAGAGAADPAGRLPDVIRNAQPVLPLSPEGAGLYYNAEHDVTYLWEGEGRDPQPFDAALSPRKIGQGAYMNVHPLGNDWVIAIARDDPDRSVGAVTYGPTTINERFEALEAVRAVFEKTEPGAGERYVLSQHGPLVLADGSMAVIYPRMSGASRSGVGPGFVAHNLSQTRADLATIYQVLRRSGMSIFDLQLLADRRGQVVVSDPMGMRERKLGEPMRVHDIAAVWNSYDTLERPAGPKERIRLLDMADAAFAAKWHAQSPAPRYEPNQQLLAAQEREIAGLLAALDGGPMPEATASATTADAQKPSFELAEVMRQMRDWRQPVAERLAGTAEPMDAQLQAESKALDRVLLEAQLALVQSMQGLKSFRRSPNEWIPRMPDGKTRPSDRASIPGFDVAVAVQARREFDAQVALLAAKERGESASNVARLADRVVGEAVKLTGLMDYRSVQRERNERQAEWGRSAVRAPGVVERQQPPVDEPDHVAAAQTPVLGRHLERPPVAPEITYGEPDPLAEGLNPRKVEDACVPCGLAMNQRLAEGQRFAENQRIAVNPDLVEPDGLHAMSVLVGDIRTLGEIQAFHGEVAYERYTSGDDALRSIAESGQTVNGYLLLVDRTGDKVSHLINVVSKDGDVRMTDAAKGREVIGFEAGEVHVIITHVDGKPLQSSLPQLLLQPVPLDSYPKYAADVAAGARLPFFWHKGQVGRVPQGAAAPQRPAAIAQAATVLALDDTGAGVYESADGQRYFWDGVRGEAVAFDKAFGAPTDGRAHQMRALGEHWLVMVPPVPRVPPMLQASKMMEAAQQREKLNRELHGIFEHIQAGLGDRLVQQVVGTIALPNDRAGVVVRRPDSRPTVQSADAATAQPVRDLEEIARILDGEFLAYENFALTVEADGRVQIGELTARRPLNDGESLTSTATYQNAMVQAQAFEAERQAQLARERENALAADPSRLAAMMHTAGLALHLERQAPQRAANARALSDAAEALEQVIGAVGGSRAEIPKLPELRQQRAEVDRRAADAESFEHTNFVDPDLGGRLRQGHEHQFGKAGAMYFDGPQTRPPSAAMQAGAQPVETAPAPASPAVAKALVPLRAQIDAIAQRAEAARQAGEAPDRETPERLQERQRDLALAQAMRNQLGGLMNLHREPAPPQTVLLGAPPAHVSAMVQRNDAAARDLALRVQEKVQTAAARALAEAQANQRPEESIVPLQEAHDRALGLLDRLERQRGKPVSPQEVQALQPPSAQTRPGPAGHWPERGIRLHPQELTGSDQRFMGVNAAHSLTACVNVAVTIDRLRSAPDETTMSAVPSEAKTLQDVRAIYGDPPIRKFGSAAAARAYLAGLPGEAAGFVAMNDPDGSRIAHMFNYERRGEAVVMIDGISGRYVQDFEASEVYVIETHAGGDATRVDRTRSSQDELRRQQTLADERLPGHWPQGRFAGTAPAVVRPSHGRTRPAPPDSFGPSRSWEALAGAIESALAQDPKTQQVGAISPDMELSEADTATQRAIAQDAPPGWEKRYVVETRNASQVLFGPDGLRGKRSNVHETLEQAVKAAAKRPDGASVHVVMAPVAANGQPPVAWHKASSDMVLATHVVLSGGALLPVAIANPDAQAWPHLDLRPAGRGHIYNAVLTMPVGRPAEYIFKQGGIEEGADAAQDALDSAVEDGRVPSVVIGAGYANLERRPETSGPGGAAVSGYALRVYMQQKHGVEMKVRYLVDRTYKRVMEAALQSLGERPGIDYEIVMFNRRRSWGRRREARSQAFLEKFKPDVLMGYDVPGRTANGDYRDSSGKDVSAVVSGADQVYIDGYKRPNTKVIVGLDIGNEAGGGNPEVHPRVQPAPDGTPIASIVRADVAMTGARTNWVGYAFATEMLRRAGALNAVPTAKAYSKLIIDMMRVGAVDSEIRSDQPYKLDGRGRSAGVGGMSPAVEGAVAAMLRVSAQAAPGKFEPDLRGVRLRLGVFDSGNGGILAAAEIKRGVEERTGARVDLVIIGDHGAGTYGELGRVGGVTAIADRTNGGLQVGDALGIHLMVMGCNTACTSGRDQYARGIGVPVVDLILSTREFHKGLVDAGERVVAFSTQPTATLPLPGTNLIGVYRDNEVLPVGGTDAGFDLAGIVNVFLADPMNPALQQRMQDAADHYADKILAAKPDVTTVSWCCTHYPELERFFAKSLAQRGRSDVKMVNPMAYQTLQAIEMAKTLPPGMGGGPGKVVVVTSAVEDKQAAIAAGVDPAKATVDQNDVLQAARIALQREDITLMAVPPAEFNANAALDKALEVLDNESAGDPIDALQAYDPSGRSHPIHVPGGAYRAAESLSKADKPLVVVGTPVRTANGLAPDSDSTKGAATIASALAKLGKDTTCVTMPSNVKPLEAALKALGRDDVKVVGFGLRAGPQARAETMRMLQDMGTDALMGVQVPGRDAEGECWNSAGERITDEVAALYQFFYTARELNAAGGPQIEVMAVVRDGPDAGTGSVDKRVRRAPNGQRIASEITAQVVTAGVGSWGADAVVAALEASTGNHKLLPTSAEVPLVIRAITANGGVDSQSRSAIDDAAGYGPEVHVGMNELFRQAAREVEADRAAEAAAAAAAAALAKAAASSAKGGKRKKGAKAKAAEAAAAQTAAQTPSKTAPPPLSAAFRGDEWPDIWKRLQNGGFGNDNVYVYRVTGEPDLYADPTQAADLQMDQIDGWGRVAAGTNTVRWYGQTVPGEGVRGLAPHREMGSKLGLEPKAPKETSYLTKDLQTGATDTSATRPGRDERRNPDLLIRKVRTRPPREASPQPTGDWFIVSNQPPRKVDAANGLQGVPRGNDQFTLPSVEKKPKLPGGWGTRKSIKAQTALALVAMLGMGVTHAINPDQFRDAAPTGIVSLPANPLEEQRSIDWTPGFAAEPLAMSQATRFLLSDANDLQRQLDAERARPAPNPTALQKLQADADRRWSDFSQGVVLVLQENARTGANPLQTANRLRAELIAGGSFSLRGNTAIRQAVRDSGLLKGTMGEVQAEFAYARLVATHPAFVNEQAARQQAVRQPATFVLTSLIDMGPKDLGYDRRVTDNAFLQARIDAEEVVSHRLADGDIRGAAAEVARQLDASDPASRATVAVPLVRLFEAEHTEALAQLSDLPLSEMGDYLAQYREAPPEVAQPLAEAVHLRLSGRAREVKTMSDLQPLLVGLSALVDAADGMAAQPVWAERFAAQLLDARIGEGTQFCTNLPQAVKKAVELGGGKLPVALANALLERGDGDRREQVIGAIDEGLQAQKSRFTESLENVRGKGHNSVGSSMSFYLANFRAQTPADREAGRRHYRAANPEVAAQLDRADDVVTQWAKSLDDLDRDLVRMRAGAQPTEAENALNQTREAVYENDDLKLAKQSSPQLRERLLADLKFEVPDPRTSIEYLLNPTMFVARHISGSLRMSWTMLADAQFNSMAADPLKYAKQWDAFKGKTERLATTLKLTPTEVREGTAVVDEFLDKVKKLDPGLSDAARVDALARLGSELDSKLQGLLKIGAKGINNATGAHTAFGQVLRWAANAGFLTHNLSTNITNFRPMADDVADYARWYHRIYEGTQAFFIAKPYTTWQATGSRAGNRIAFGGVPDVEGTTPWRVWFAAGTAGVGVADLALFIGQAQEVPAMISVLNFGMGISGVADGGIGLINLTGAALARAGAVELAAILAIPAEAATVAGLGVALFTALKQFYNVRHHYDVVDAREIQRDPALAKAVKDMGFSHEQAAALLNTTHEGVSPMQLWNEFMKSKGKTVPQGLEILQFRLAMPGQGGIPAQDWIATTHRLIDHKMDDDDGSFPASDPGAAEAGMQVSVEHSMPDGAYYTLEAATPQSLEGLANYAQRQWGLTVD